MSKASSFGESTLRARIGIDTLIRSTGLGETPERLKILGNYLGIVARGKPYGRRYVVSVLNGTVKPGKVFLRAIDTAINLTHNNPVPVTVRTKRAIPKLEQAVVSGEVRKCGKCNELFLTDVYNRKYCHSCSPPSWMES